MSFAYRVYGLNLEVPFEIPGLHASGDPPDVVVKEGDVPRRLEAPEAEGLNWDAAPGRFLLRGGPRAGRFFIEDGERITFHRNPGAEDVTVHMLLLNTVMAAVLRQRGHLVLHASAAVVNGRAVVMCGEPGAGKSTTLAALIGRGASMLTDDVTPLEIDPSGTVHVVPGAPQLHLCEDVATALGHDVETLPRYNTARRKVVVSVDGAMANESFPMRSLFLIEMSDAACVDRLSGAEKFAAVQASLCGPVLAGDHLLQLPLLDVYRISRLEEGWSPAEVAAAIVERL